MKETWKGTGAEALTGWKNVLCTSKGEPRGTHDNETPVLPEEAERLWAATRWISDRRHLIKVVSCCMFAGRTTIVCDGRSSFTADVVNHCISRGFNFADGMFAAITLRENGVTRQTAMCASAVAETTSEELTDVWATFCLDEKIHDDFLSMCRTCADAGLKLPRTPPPIVDDPLALDALWRTVGNATSVAPVSVAALIPGLYSVKMKLSDPARMAKSALAQARRVAYLAWERHGIVPPPGYCRQSLLRGLSRARSISRIADGEKVASRVVSAIRQMSACIGSGSIVDDTIRKTCCFELDRYFEMFRVSLSLVVACHGGREALTEIASTPVGEDVAIDMPDVGDLALFMAVGDEPIGIDDEETGCSVADEPVEERQPDLFSIIERESEELPHTVSAASIWER